MDVDDAIHRRRSIRRFRRDRSVPAEVLSEVLDAGRWAPSSCNLQTWDFVVVDDEALKQALATETKSVLIAPVSVFVVYDRELARDGLANVQSASAAIENILLKATSVGLASLWVNALGDRARVRELLGVPDDFEVLALVCLGYPADAEPPPAPERRPLAEVVHRNRYGGAGALPKSPDPDRWSLAEIALYFKRKLQSGTRYNKPLPSFVPPVMEAVARALGPPRPGERLLDALSGTGLFTELLHRARPDAELAVLEIGADAHFFAERRAGGKVGFVPFPLERRAEILAHCAPPGAKVQIARESGGLPVMPRVLPFPRLAEPGFDRATLLFRLEGIPHAERPRLLAEVRDQLASGGRLVLAFVSRRSWHGPAYALRRRLGRDSVEYAPAPEPNLIGPYRALAPGEVRRLAREAGFQIEREERLFPLPDLAALGPRLAKSGGLGRAALGVLKVADAVFRPFAALLQPFARVRILWLKRP